MSSILITGGTGSFGQAYIDYLHRGAAYDRICVYSRGEHAQAAMRERLGEDARIRYFIGDVRDRDRLMRAMHGVDTVVHAAALKRIEVGHYNPDEMVKTNILGTMNVIDACHAMGVRRAVLVSTDKAWQPVSAYGQSKAMAESLWLAANQSHAGATSFSAVRYGNIFASAGSIVPKWRRLKDEGANVLPVTDPDCTRFMMRQPDAIALVEDALRTTPDAWWKTRGSLVLPKNLEAYRVGDLAEAFGLPITTQGLPSWEKLHEGLCDGYTSDQAPRVSVAQLRDALERV